MIECKIGFIGAGNMTQAIVTGMLESGIIKPDLIVVSAPSKTNFPFWQEKGISTTHSNDATFAERYFLNPAKPTSSGKVEERISAQNKAAEVVNKCDVIMLGMKPQYLDEAIKSFDRIPNNKLYISILAGITIETLNDVSVK